MTHWIKDFKSPKNLFPLIISIISLIFAFISYDSRTQGRELSYKVIHNKILDVSLQDEVTDFYSEDGNLIEHDVWVSYVSFWNSGRASINKEDILKDVSIDLIDEGRIISVDKVLVRGEGITKIDFSSRNEKSIVLNLDQLDLDMGVKYKIVYTSKSRDNRNLLDFIYSSFGSYEESNSSTFFISGYIKEGSIVDSILLEKQVFIVIILILILLISLSIALVILSKFLNKKADVLSIINVLSYQLIWVTVLFVILLSCLMIYLMVFGSGPGELGTSIYDEGILFK